MCSFPLSNKMALVPRLRCGSRKSETMQAPLFTYGFSKKFSKLLFMYRLIQRYASVCDHTVDASQMLSFASFCECRVSSITLTTQFTISTGTILTSSSTSRLISWFLRFPATTTHRKRTCGQKSTNYGRLEVKRNSAPASPLSPRYTQFPTPRNPQSRHPISPSGSHLYQWSPVSWPSAATELLKDATLFLLGTCLVFPKKNSSSNKKISLI